MATQRALKLSKKYQRRLHILHLSTVVEADLLRQDKPSWVTAEVTPQHLVLNTSAYETIGTLAQMNPPLRSPHDNEVLWQALRDGFIDFIAQAAAYGIPNKGAIAPGDDADLVLVDLNTYRPVKREELLTKCGWSPFEGWNLT